MTPYQIAIEQTTEAINRRAANYRNLVVTVVLIGVGAVVAAMVSRSLAFFALGLLCVPATGVFFFLDARLLAAWRSRLLASWVPAEIDFAALAKAVCAIPHLPPRTLSGMLETLPDADDLVTEHAISRITREAVAEAVTAVHTCRAYHLVCRSAVSAMVVVPVLCAILWRAWYPLPFAAVALLEPAVVHWLKRRRFQSTLKRVPDWRADPSFQAGAFETITAKCGVDQIGFTRAQKVEQQG